MIGAKETIISVSQSFKYIYTQTHTLLLITWVIQYKSAMPILQKITIRLERNKLSI